ncbi:MAG: hypothetical protein J5J00_11795 [Deltaproteobacteria bacterium]|nr:hypothetical protein [Deltaproteobacteria bacterium]
MANPREADLERWRRDQKKGKVGPDKSAVVDGERKKEGDGGGRRGYGKKELEK